MKNIDTSKIPHGDYCYTFNGENSIDKETGMPLMGVDYCPYYSTREFNGVVVNWCEFLECGDVGNDGCEEDYDKLIEHFGSEDKLKEILPLFLLWDGIKECGENKYED